MKIRIVALVLLQMSLYQSCTQREAKTAESSKENSCAPLNPNGDSERALMMRKMAVLSEANAEALRSGKDLVEYNGEFSGLALTHGTMPVDSAFFQGMSARYIQVLEELYAAPVSERIQLHNNLVATCQDCHAQTCRGPLKRIDKMIVSK